MKKNTINTIIGILSLLLIVAVVGVVLKFTNGLNEDFKSFYVEHNGKQIVSANSDITLDYNSEHKFDCKYLSTPEDSSFNVKIVPNVNEETDFEFIADDKTYMWSSLKDLTPAFDLTVEKDYFILSIPSDFSVFNVLTKLNPYSNISITESLPEYNRYFCLVVSNYNESIVYKINFNVYSILEYENTINDLTNQLQEKNDEIAGLNFDNEILENTIENYRTENNNLLKLISDNNVKINQLETDKVNNLSTIEKLRSDNARLNALVDSNNVQINSLRKDKEDLENSIETLQDEIEHLNSVIQVLQERIESYENYIAGLEDDSTAVVTLEVNGNVYSAFTIAKGSKLFDISVPDTDDYSFNGWLLNGESVCLNSYYVNENVTFIADLLSFYTVTFLDFYDEPFYSIKVKDGGSFVAPEFPETLYVKYDFYYVGDDLDISLLPNNTYENVSSNLTFNTNAVVIGEVRFKVEDIFTFGVRCSLIDWSNLEQFDIDVSTLGFSVPVYYGQDECSRATESTDYYIFMFDTTKYSILDEKYEELQDGETVYISFTLVPTTNPRWS